MPQAVVERIFAFMVTEKTGRIELDFKGGRLMSVKVTEFLRVSSAELIVPDRNGLDDNGLLAQDSER